MTVLTEARTLAKSLKALSKSCSKLQTANTLTSAPKARDRVYEFYVDLRAINDLSAHWELKMVTPTTSKHLRLPHGPASKTSYPFFVAIDKATKRTVFQICLGTEIANASGTTFAPDLSIQIPGASMTPNSAELVFGWDQKRTDSKRLDRDEVAKVAFYLSLIRPTGKLSVDPFPSGFWPNKSAVITNTKGSTLNDSDLKSASIAEVSYCHPGKSAVTRP